MKVTNGACVSRGAVSIECFHFVQTGRTQGGVTDRGGVKEEKSVAAENQTAPGAPVPTVRLRLYTKNLQQENEKQKIFNFFLLFALDWNPQSHCYKPQSGFKKTAPSLRLAPHHHNHQPTNCGAEQTLNPWPCGSPPESRGQLNRFWINSNSVN